MRLQDDSEDEDEAEGNEEEHEEEERNEDREMEGEPQMTHGKGAAMLEQLESIQIQQQERHAITSECGSNNTTPCTT